MIRKRTTLTTSEKKQRLILFLFVVVLIGAGCGTFAPLAHPDSSLWELLQLFHCSGASGLSGWTGIVASASLFLVCLFLVGFSAIGQPGALVTLLCYGICLGGTLREQCTGALAPMQCAGLLLYYVPLSVLMVIAARESLRFSGFFSAYSFRNDPAENMYHQFRLYCTRFAVLTGFLLLLASLYSICLYGLTIAKTVFANT